MLRGERREKLQVMVSGEAGLISLQILLRLPSCQMN